MKPLPTLPPQETLPPENRDEAGFGALRTERGCLPLTALDVRTRITGLLARTDLAQTFVNAHAEPLEATYVFPLPDRAAITRFRLEVAGRVIEGDLKERGQARKDYAEAIEAGHRAAISEEDRPGVFTIRVGNLPPGENAVVRLSLTGPLPYSDGEATFRFPLVVAPRYVPGMPLPGPSVGAGTAADTDAVPDASRITPPVLLPGFPNPVTLSLEVTFTGSLVPENLRSSLHSIVEEASAGRITVRLQPGERLDRDFILRYRLAADRIRTALSVQPDTDGAEGTFALTLVPPTGPTAARPRDVLFVLDRSGSMGGWKMVAARRALARMVDTLGDADRFAVLAFDDSVETPPDVGEGLAPATDRHRFRAIEFLSGIAARGGTEMAQPLQRGVALLTDTSRDRILVLVTDGQVGNEDQLLRQLGPRAKGMRVFTLGIDRAVNAAFLRRLADLGGGACELVESEDRLDEVMDAIHRRIAAPVLSHLELEPAGLSIVPGSVTPARLLDLFAGTPLVILGRYRGQPAGAVSLQARDAGGSPWSAEVRADNATEAGLAPLWARARLRDLEDRYLVDDKNRAGLEKELVATSLKFGVLCRFTAFVAVDRSEVVNQGGKVHGVIQPVEMPSGWELAVGAAPAGLVHCFTLAKGATLRARRSTGGDHRELLSAQESSSADSCLHGFEADTFEADTAGRPPRAGVGPLRKLLRRLTAKKPVKTLAIDYAPFIERAKEILRALHAVAAADPVSRLAGLRAEIDRLEELFKDLVGAGDHRDEVERLGKAVLTIRGLRTAPLAADVQSAWTDAAETLDAFLASVGSPTQPARKEFWK
jgi:Ca-activated chloride channel family protein